MNYDGGNLLDGLSPLKYAPKSASVCSKCNLNVPVSAVFPVCLDHRKKNMNYDKYETNMNFHVSMSKVFLTNGNPVQDCA